MEIQCHKDTNTTQQETKLEDSLGEVYEEARKVNWKRAQRDYGRKQILLELISRKGS